MNARHPPPLITSGRVKTRMQCTPIGTYSGPLECVTSIVRKEGLRALYKGASPPAVGWAITDAILLGSLVSRLGKHRKSKSS